MIRRPKHPLANYPRQTRDELAAAWEHLVTAAEQGARHVSQTSRRRGKVAQDRALAAALALRGERSPTPWRWLGTALAAGLVIGAVGSAVLTRRRRDVDQDVPDRPPSAPETLHEQAGASAEAIREETRSAVHGAAGAVRDAAAKVRHRVTRRDSAGDPEETGPTQPPPAGAPAD